MSGHSKFANIKHKKEKNDAAKGKIFTIIGQEIIGNHIKDNEYKEILEKIEEKEEPLTKLPEHESMTDFDGLEHTGKID